MSKSQRDRRRHYLHINYMCDRLGMDRTDRNSLAVALLNLNPNEFDSIAELGDDELDQFIMALRACEMLDSIRLADPVKSISNAKRVLRIYDTRVADVISPPQED